ncbi:redoxin domain-containing protein [Paenibacillus lautus]|uniref:redoxin domain-containing protein n=1 Tax=Paenibacillus lautus TaxID=1401 RepID=UPI0010DE184D|nr:redoxin domain-containing protein [Cytobacillus firmus]VTR24127.1 thioredoxin-dependent thiol peroxidase [Actinobacillus pleuropneumoniae]
MNNWLQSGEYAPVFQSVDQNGNIVSLEAYRGRKVLLAFFRNAACALCNLRVHQFIQRYPQWQDPYHLDVICFFESPEAALHRYVGQQDAPFPLIADPNAELYALYGVETSADKTRATLAQPNVHEYTDEAEAAGFKLTPEEGSNFNRIPAEFLIDERGIVRIAHYGRLITDHLPYETIERYAAETQLP